eukprot:scaffold3516_cov878-Pavlova_lutheri.AAC.1
MEPWSMRLEIGSLSPECSFQSLVTLRHQLGLDSHETFLTTPEHIRPIEFPLDLIKEYIVKHIGLWWREIEQSVTAQSLCEDGFLRACWAEQALQSCNFVLRGQPVWDYNTCVVFLRVASREGYFRPRSIFEEAHEICRNDGHRISKMVQQVLKIHCRVWERDTLLRLFSEFDWMKEKTSLLRHRPDNERQLIRQMALRLIRNFYSDLHAHMYHKRRWTCTEAPFFLSLLDVRQDPTIPGSNHLREEYGGKESKVHPFRDRGGVEVDAFLRRWFPVHGYGMVKASAPIQYATPHLWCALANSLARGKYMALQKTIGTLACDLRTWHLHERGVEVELRSALPLLVPDALTGQRVFHQLNHWRVVVGTGSYMPVLTPRLHRDQPHTAPPNSPSTAALREERIEKEVRSVQHQAKVH